MIPRWLYSSSGGTGYVNQGPDRRAGGLVGTVLAFIQRTLSFHSDSGPFSYAYRRAGWKVGLEFSRPWGLPFLMIFIPHRRVVDRRRWWSLRIGWRWDRNWGRGGYIADVIQKSRIDNLV